MAANPTIYCLEHITDYFAFERLCDDLMALEGYSSIEPLGGFADKGRDAIHVSKSDKTTIFAYSVRENWRVKLAEDARKIKNHNHACDELAFVSTAEFSAGERDEAVNSIRNGFGWELNLYGLERIRILLDAKYPHLKLKHPQIFPAQFLSGPEPPEPSEPDHIFINFAPGDFIFAEWLARKLTSEGYGVWCERFKTLGDDPYPDDPIEAIDTRTFCFISIYSEASLSDQNVTIQRTAALNKVSKKNRDFFVPLSPDQVDRNRLDRISAALNFIDFSGNWVCGFQELLERLDGSKCPKPLHGGRSIAARTYLPRKILLEQPEILTSNCLEVLRVPAVIYRFESNGRLPDDIFAQLKCRWAFRTKKPNLFLSFHQPPLISDSFQMKSKGGSLWAYAEDVDGISPANLVSELVHKSLMVRCHDKGLLYCQESKLHFTPDGMVKGNSLKFKKPDGSKSRVKVCGKRKLWRPTGSTDYLYYMAPVFSARRNLFGDLTVLVRIMFRFTNTEGQIFDKRANNSRRKHLSKDWWNDGWLNRIYAICQYLGEDGQIRIGEGEEEVAISAQPLQTVSQFSIDEGALDLSSFDFTDPSFDPAFDGSEEESEDEPQEGDDE